jgi:hypothetical protein
VILLLIGCADERELPDAQPAHGVHPTGYVDETSENFHGKDIVRRDYDLKLCTKCHGDDYRGGGAGVSCMKCHTDGPTACYTCHSERPTTKSHPSHATLACTECHVVPDRWDAPGHFDNGPTVTFGALASLRTQTSFADGTCTVYCHQSSKPTWGATPTGSCSACHGAPPASHAQSQCASCHPASAPHVDGIVQVGNACDSCHGKAGDPAPPNDLSGNMFTTSLGVGAHQAHLKVPSGLRTPIPCATCHVVPSSVSSAGHIDSALPAEVNASIGWDRTTQTCTTSCHLAAHPRWTETGGATCGSCHGVPPTSPSHTPDMPITSCANCHPANFAKHIDGVIDVL